MGSGYSLSGDENVSSDTESEDEELDQIVVNDQIDRPAPAGSGSSNRIADLDEELQPYNFLPDYKPDGVTISDKSASAEFEIEGNVSFTRSLGRGHALRLKSSNRLDVWFTTCTPDQISNNDGHAKYPPCSQKRCGNTCYPSVSIRFFAGTRIRLVTTCVFRF